METKHWTGLNCRKQVSLFLLFFGAREQRAALTKGQHRPC